MEQYKEIVLEEKRLYSGGIHELKIWTCGLESGFIVNNGINKKMTKFDNYKDAKLCFNEFIKQ